MSRIFDEEFEGAGYEESWESEVAGSGSSIDEDANVTSAGSPSDWGSQCCEIINNANATYVAALTTTDALKYWRVEFVITAESLPNSETTDLFAFYDNSGSDPAGALVLGQDGGGDLYLSFESYHTGSINQYTSFVTPVLDTRYRFELKWDTTNDLWSWKIDGQVQPNDEDASDPVLTEGTLTLTRVADAGAVVLGSISSGAIACTCYYDLVCAENADWIGTEATDSTPDQFYFVDQTNVAVDTVIYSNTIDVTDINTTANISISGNDGEFSINSGSYTSTPTTVSRNDTVRLRQTSSASVSTLVNTTLTIDTISDQWDVTTTAASTNQIVTIEGKGIIANCDALTNDTGGTGTGDWTEEGGGTMTLTPDVFLFGTSSIAGKYANKDGFQQFDLGVGNELDFDTAGDEEGQHIYIWVNMAAFAVLDDISTGGLFIRISSSSPGITNYKDYCIAGGNGSSNGVDANGWTGGWKLFMIDPTKTATATNGSCDIGAIRTLGLQMETWDSVRAESIFIDQIAVGSGIRITGDSTEGWKEAMEYCTDYASRAWGMIQERDGIYYIFGKVYIGDTSQAANTSFEDFGRVIQFGTSQYYNSVGSWVTSMASDACGIIIEDHASYRTNFTDGVLVGTDSGRSGSVIIGNSDQAVSLDLYGGNNATSVTKVYGTSFKDLTGSINSGNDVDHKFFSVSFSGCSQFDPIGVPVIRNCVFAETANTDAALLWNANIDIQDCNFIANTIGAGIEHESGATATYTKLYFDGNTYDVLNSTGSAMTVTKAGTPQSDPTSSEGSSVSFEGAVDITLTIKDEDGDLLSGITTGVYQTSDRTELLQEDTNISGIADDTYTGSTPVEVEVRCRQASSGGTKYKNYSSVQNITSSGLVMTITLIEDPNNNATT